MTTVFVECCNGMVSEPSETTSLMMFRTRKLDSQNSSGLAMKKKKKKTILVGLKCHSFSREMLLRLLTLLVDPGDNVLAIHVQELYDDFDPNSFHIHEDICKSKQVDLQVKVCSGDSFIAELVHQVRLHFATMLVIGCSSSRPKESIVTSCLKGLPPICTLLVMDNAGRIVIQMQGTSQQGSSCQNLQSTCHSPRFTSDSCVRRTKSETAASTSKSSPIRRSNTGINDVKNGLQVPEITLQKQFQKLAILEVQGTSKRFTLEELELATNYFSPEMVIGEGGQSKVYKAKFGNSQFAAVKVLQISQWSGEELLREVEILSGLNHDSIIQLVGYCYSVDMHAVVYNLQQGSLKQNLPLLQWSERMRIAVGVAKALEYLHHSCSPPIIHRDVKSSNILLSCQCQPRLSDFGASIMHHQQPTSTKKPIHVVGTFGYLAPEYMMYGKVDKKIDVYSYGVVLLELITGKEAIQANLTSNHESLVLWARSLLNRGLCNRLIDPRLSGDYDKDEMQRMMIAARLCLMHSYTRRPTMEIILKLLEDPDHPLKMIWEKEECIDEINSPYEAGLRTDVFSTNKFPIITDT